MCTQPVTAVHYATTTTKFRFILLIKALTNHICYMMVIWLVSWFVNGITTGKNILVLYKQLSTVYVFPIMDVQVQFFKNHLKAPQSNINKRVLNQTAVLLEHSVFSCSTLVVLLNFKTHYKSLTSSTLMFSFALVSNRRMLICSANFCASFVSTTLEFGSSFLLPTKNKEQQRHIRKQAFELLTLCQSSILQLVLH